MAAGVLTGCGSGSAGASGTAAAATCDSTGGGKSHQSLPAPSAALVAKAKAEGKLVWYDGVGLNLPEIGKAFKDAYGITVEFQNASSVPLQTRFSTESQAGTYQADVINTSNANDFIVQSDKAGYLLPIDEVIPGFAMYYPADYLIADGQAAVMTIIPTLLTYNTGLVKGSDVPKDYTDLASPKYKGKLIAYDPRRSVGGLSYYNALLDAYGPDWLKAVGANTRKYYDSPVSLLQGLSAGEGAITLSSTASSVAGLVAKGAPLKSVEPPFVWAAQFTPAVSAHAPHPAAARLFAYWAYSEAGQAAINAAQQASSPLCLGALPKKVTGGDPAQAARNKTRILDLLGLPQQ
ncbi:extracellular solute-binding protein [Streptomyces sp. NBC_00988]|uniref:ABC transporter substrate-binding protein n=1 Tax=Streptomyces sp. NBC_00988 TaxID=2903704 RepID=UPI00386F8FB4|nr:extracellular solute-binding protein [Streptomyces sp. NBC_00988]